MAESESNEVSKHLPTVFILYLLSFSMERPDSGARVQFTRVRAARVLAFKRGASCTHCHLAAH